MAQRKLVAPNPAAGDRAGNAVAMAGDTVIVGSPFDDVGSHFDQGSAVVYERAGMDWALSQQLFPPSGSANAHFGLSVAVAGDTAVVGTAAYTGPDVTYGGAHVFQRTAGTWSFVQTLQPLLDPQDTGFGFSLAIDSETLVVGGFDGATVFTRENGSWGQRQRLDAPAEATSFGQAVAISGDLVVAGSPVLNNHVGPGAPAGAAYVFERTGGTFTRIATITSSNAADESHFGRAVAISGTTVLVGARRASGDPAGMGVAYVFVRVGSTFVLQATLKASDRVAGDEFGTSVALLGDMALVGAPFHEHQNQNANQGSAYLFMRSGSTWSQKEELRAVDGQNNDFFGSSLTLSGASAVAGSPNDDFPSVQAQGSAYVFTLASQMGEACGAGSMCPSGFCSDGRCCSAPCAGACDACSEAAGAARDGECSLLAAGSPGSPSCVPATCTGASDTCPSAGTCESCATDAGCGEAEYCSAAGVCLPRKNQGRACEQAAGTDCREAGCRVCATGACVDGFCCDSSCDGECLACSGVFTGQQNGLCAPLIASADPTHACEPNEGSGFVQVSAGDSFTCGLRTDSRIACWGRNDMGQADPPAGTFTFVATGSQASCGVRTGGGVACWGDGRFGLLAPPAGSVARLSLKYHHACAAKSAGPAVCWGSNLEGRATPPSENVVEVATGSVHGCGLRADGSVGCWGASSNNFGQTSPPAGAYHSLAGGSLTTCALRADNSIACWGLNVSVGVPPPSGTFRVIDLGFSYGCGIRSDDTIGCWGATGSPVGLVPAGTFKSLSTGAFHACAVRMDDRVVCWGTNQFGELNVP